MPEQSSYTPDQRAAMRAYLQRAEVRLSTMHRVAGVFLNGAGLLILLPVLFRDIIVGVITLFSQHAKYDLGGTSVVSYLYMVLTIPFVISMYIPIRALYLLLKDLVDFYFIGHSPGFPSNLFSPRFVLSGIAFSPDEGKEAKDAVIVEEYTNLAHFVLPFDEDHASYFSHVLNQAGDDIIPSTRSRENLPQAIAQDARRRGDVDRLNVAFGMAGMVDRHLTDEVAKTETSLVRHALSLRRLVLRYAKALLVVVWTTLISFSIVSLSEVFAVPLLLISTLYLVWGLCTPFIVRLPLHWIFESADRNSKKVTAKDRHLVLFEREVTILSGCAALISALVTILLLVTRAVSN